MKFYTKKGKQIYCTCSIALGGALFVWLIAFAVTSSMWKTEIYVPHQEIEQAVGEAPNTSDYDGGYLNEDYKAALKEYDKRKEAEEQKHTDARKAELHAIFIKKMGISISVAVLVGILIGIGVYRGTITILEVNGNRVCFTYQNGKQKELDIMQNEVTFYSGRVMDIRNLYIPQYIYQFEYYQDPQKRGRKDMEAVYLSKEDGETVYSYFTSLVQNSLSENNHNK